MKSNGIPVKSFGVKFVPYSELCRCRSLDFSVISLFFHLNTEFRGQILRLDRIKLTPCLLVKGVQQ